MLSHVLIAVVLSCGGKSFISGFVSSVDPCVICGLVLLELQEPTNIHKSVNEIRTLFGSS
jgi:hypothetical protein